MESVCAQVKAFLDEITERLPEEFNLLELAAKVEEKTPYVLVALQECERMNNLTRELRRSLKELDLGMKVCWVVLLRCIVLSFPFSLYLRQVRFF